MSDAPLTPPTPPPPSGSKNNSTIVVIAAAVAAVVITALIVFGMSSSNKSSTDVADTAANTTPYVPAPEPASSKYDRYYKHVLDNSGQANTIDKADLISYGDTICSALNNGQSIPYIVSYLSDRSAGETDAALFASVIFGAITYICPEYRSDLQTYLGN
jgi:hypothetical protein